MQSGRAGSVQGTFTVAFGPLPKPTHSLKPGLKKPVPAPWYVRVLPVAAGDPPALVGQPSNLVRVFDDKLPPSKPSDVKLPPTTTTLSAKLEVVRLEYTPYRFEPRRPPGCRTTPPSEDSIWEKAWDAFTGAWEGVSETYNRAKQGVVDIASTLTGNVIPKAYLGIALDAAMVAACSQLADRIMYTTARVVWNAPRVEAP